MPTSKPGLYETSKYRCLVDAEKRSDLVYLLHCGVESCHSGYEFHTDGREGYHLHVILSGKGILCVNGQETPLHFGQMFLTKPNEDAWYRADIADPWTYCWMAYDGEQARRYTEAAGFSDGINWRRSNIPLSSFYAVVKQLLEQPDLNLACELRRLGLLLEYLSLAIQSENMNIQNAHKDTEYSADLYVKYAVNYISANYATAKISGVASYIGIHRSYLTSIFRKSIGISPQEYLMQCRMNNARTLLLDSNLSIQEIAQRVGYDNALTFSKIFKTYFGVSPRHFRDNHHTSAPDAGQQNQNKENEP